MSATPATARTPRELARLPRSTELLYATLLHLVEWTGAWRFPIAASGDYEEMTLRDVLYWLHKAEHHVERPERGSNLAAYFDDRRRLECSLPTGFQVDSTVSISACGDLMDHEYLCRSRALYEQVAEQIFGADLPMANLEAVVLDEPSEAPRFDGKTAPRLRMESGTLDVVAGHEGRHYAFLSAACNHSLDFGVEGVRTTRDALSSRGISFHGINESEAEAHEARLMTRRGITVAVLSHTFGLNGWKPPAQRPWIVNRTRLNRPLDRLDLSPIHRQIAHARDAGADFLIAQLHWGMEFEHYPRLQQLTVAHALAESGIDAIFGHHPHVSQPFELYRTRRDPNRIVPVFYSLGNLTNPYRDPRLCRSLLARLKLAKGRHPDGAVGTYVQDARAENIVQTMDAAQGRISLKQAGQAHASGGI